MIEILQIDCEEYMKTVPDKHFDLAIVDPPYGIGMSKNKTIGRGRRNIKGRKERFIATSYKIKSWDSEIPNKSYFDELFRVSRNQIIFGYNYFTKYLLSTNKLIFWDKRIGDNNFSAGEIMFCSLAKNMRKVEITLGDSKNHVSNNYNLAKKNARIHPTQKPVALYRWLLDNYAKQGDLILDTHAGSFSSAVACKEKGFSGVFCEIDKDYFEAGKKRVDKTLRQFEIFQEKKPKKKVQELDIFAATDGGL